MGVFTRGSKKVSVTELTPGRAYWVDKAGGLHDLGETSVEDFRLIAHVCSQAHARVVPSRLKTTAQTLGRVRGVSRRLFDRAAAETPNP